MHWRNVQASFTTCADCRPVTSQYARSCSDVETRVANVQLLNVTTFEPSGLINFLEEGHILEVTSIADRGSVTMFVPLYAGLRVGEKSIMGCQCTKRCRTSRRRSSDEEVAHALIDVSVNTAECGSANSRCDTASKKSPETHRGPSRQPEAVNERTGINALLPALNQASGRADRTFLEECLSDDGRFNALAEYED